MASREEMFAKFQPWVLGTYGDSAKTKTITVKKAARIMTLLRAGEKGAAGEPTGSEAAKLRVWVKAKGLQLGELGEDELYVPTGTDKVRSWCSSSALHWCSMSYSALWIGF